MQTLEGSFHSIKRNDVENLTIEPSLMPALNAPPGEERESFKAGLSGNVCAAAGAFPKDVSIRIAPIGIAAVTGSKPTEMIVPSEPLWRSYAPLGLSRVKP